MTDERLAAVNRVLFELWDPMDVRAQDPNWPADEYEGYAAGVLGLFDHRASDDVVAEHLAAIETEWMGLPPSSLAHRLAAARAIRAALAARRNEDTDS
jgi:hypothetical protein